MLCEQNMHETCKTTVLPIFFSGKTPIREIDWCGFITNCLKMSNMTWDETDRGNYYYGPLLVLLVRNFFEINTLIYIVIRILINYLFVYIKNS